MTFRMCLCGVAVGALLSNGAPAAESAVIFMYHHVARDTPPVTSVTPERFREQMDFLEREGFEVLPLMMVVEALRAGDAVPDKSIVLTFDDGYESVLTVAAPELERRGWPFTVFVSTDSVDRNYGGYLGWSGLRQLVQAGATIGNHTKTHAHLVRQHESESDSDWHQRIGREIDDAAAQLATELGAAVVPVLAYPYGEYDSRVQRLVEQRGLTALGQHSGAIGATSDWTALPRFPVATGFDALEDFSLRARTRPLLLDLEPMTTHVGSDLRPGLTATIVDTEVRRSELACYATGQGLMELEWVDETAGTFAAYPKEPLRPGRSKYNCTAPSATRSGVYHWYSRLLMRRNANGSWYAE
jgi:biofilm PGA synthesis lipoprotein PgaB